MSLRKAAVCVLLLSALAMAVAVRAEDVDETDAGEEEVVERTYGLAGIETVEPMFVEESAAVSTEATAETAVDAQGFPIPLTKKQRRTTVEPRYLGEKKVKAWIAPEYAIRRAKRRRGFRGLRNKKNKKPRVFKSHYFSPMPKPKKGVRYPPPPGQKRKRRNRKKLVPLFSAETPSSHTLHKGYIVPEMMNKLPNKYDPIDRSKFTMAPAPSTVPPKPFDTAENAAKANALPPATPVVPVALVEAEAETESEAEAEVDTSAEAEAEFESEFGSNPPPFSAEEMGDRHLPTMIESAESFAADGFQTPDWNDEAAPSDFAISETALNAEDEESEAEADESAAVDTAAAEADAAAYEDMEAEQSLIEAASKVDVEAEDTDEADEEESDESEDETEDESETDSEDESEAEADEEDADEDSEEDADESEDESDEEAGEEEADPIALVESAAHIFGVEGLTADQFNAMDEQAQNELLVKQVDMDAVSDEAAARAGDEEEEASAEGQAEGEAEAEAEEGSEEAADTEELEENEMDTNEALAELVETQALDHSVDTLLAEVDSHLTSNDEGANDAESGAEAEAEATADSEAEAESKGTPGSSVGAGMTWDQANEAAADEADAEEAAKNAAIPKVPAKVVSSTADLHNSEPEFDSEPDHAESIAPQMVDALPEQTAQMVLLEKIAKLKALRRN